MLPQRCYADIFDRTVPLGNAAWHMFAHDGGWRQLPQRETLRLPLAFLISLSDNYIKAQQTSLEENERAGVPNKRFEEQMRRHRKAWDDPESAEYAIQRAIR